jgi:subtilisin family serine protease
LRVALTHPFPQEAFAMQLRTPLALLVVTALAACSETPAPLAPEADVQAARVSDAAPIYLVTFHEGVDVDATTDDLAGRHGFAVRSRRHFAAPGFSAVLPRGLAAQIAADPRVALVEEDGPVSLIHPIRTQARPGGGGGQATPWGIARVGGAGNGTGKTAWVIDTGIDLAHADLNTSRNCHANFVAKGKDDPNDGNGHGTHVAGTIAAINNNIDVVGVAANAYVCAVRVLDNSGSGTWEGVVNGVNYVAGAAASGDVANMSLGGSGSNATLENAISSAASKGIRFVLAAGNNGADAANYTPARVNGTNIFTIAAIASNDCLTSWSNWGNPPVDYAAPGASVLSTRKGGGTTTMSGTSMAAPHVAGILLLGGVKSDGNACGDAGKRGPHPISVR